jgi:hypothetical protein
MPISAAEREEESRLTSRERDTSNLPGAAADWEKIGDHYKDHQSKLDCCYLCEAGRAYNRAAIDYRKAGKSVAADAALKKAAEAYALCGGTCSEAGEFLCAETGLSQAKLIYERIEKNAKSAGDAAAEAKAKQGRTQAEKGITVLRKLKADLEKKRKDAFDKKDAH